MNWKALTPEVILNRVDQALEENTNYHQHPIMGVPGTYLDQEEFYRDAPFLKQAPFLKTMVANPNHIGCHTLGHGSSPMFKGTQEIEKELVALCAEQIFKGEPGQQDGYVATGGTEANLEAVWIYRNYYQKEYRAKCDQIAVIYSEDTHYSIPKACNLMQVKSMMLPVQADSRQIKLDVLEKNLQDAVNGGIRYFIVIINLSTTLFGSVDEIEPIATILEDKQLPYKMHIDAAFGGFIYPFTNPHSKHNFRNSRISSITIDGHKMLQTPYGTGLFLIRKGFMQYVITEEAQYVPGLDYTLCGSRSGANAISIWMLLMRYGGQGWSKKMKELMDRTNFLCAKLEVLEIPYFRNPYLNIVCIPAKFISSELASKYGLVADTYEFRPSWWKIVVMDHVKIPLLESFLNELTGIRH